MATVRVKFWLRWLFRVAVIIGILLLAAVANLEGIGGWLLRGRLQALGLGEVEATVHTIALDHAIVGPFRLGKHGLGAEYVRVDFANLSLRDTKISSVRLTDLRIPLERTATGWEVSGLDQLLALRDPNAAPVIIPEIRVDSGTLAIIADGREVEVPFTALFTTTDAVTWTVAITLRPSGDAIELTATINTADGSGPARLVATRLHPERHLELIELGLGDQLPPMVLRGDADVTVDVTLANYAPTSETLTVNLRDGRAMLTQPAEQVSDAMAEFTSLKLRASREVGATERIVTVSARRLVTWVVMDAGVGDLERRIDCEIDDLACTVRVPMADPATGNFTVSVGGLRVDSGAAYLALGDLEASAESDMSAVRVATVLQGGSYGDYQLAGRLQERNLTINLADGKWSVGLTEIGLSQPEVFDVVVRDGQVTIPAAAPSTATGTVDAAIRWVRLGEVAIGEGRAQVTVGADRVGISTPGLPVTVGTTVTGTVIARDLLVSYPAGRPLSGELDVDLQALVAGPVTLGATRVSGRIAVPSPGAAEDLVVTAADIPVTVTGGYAGTVGQLRVSMPNTVDFGGDAVMDQIRAQSFALGVDSLTATIKEFPVSIETIRVAGRIDDLSVEVAGIASENLPGVSARGHLRGDATAPMQGSLAEFRITVDPKAVPMPDGWTLSGPAHDLALRVETRAADSGGDPLAVTVLLPAGDTGEAELEEARGMDDLNLRLPTGQIRGRPKLRLQVRRAADGHFSGDLSGGLHEISLNLGGVEVAGGTLDTTAAVENIGIPGANAVLPDLARFSVGIAAESITGYGMTGAATVRAGLDLQRTEEGPHALAATAAATLGGYARPDLTVSGISASASGRLLLPTDSSADTPKTWGAWLGELDPMNRTISGHAEVGFDRLVAADNKITALAARTDYKWAPRAGFTPTVTPDGFTVRRMKIGKIDVQPVSWPVSLDGRELTIAGAMESALLEIRVDHTTTMRLLPSPSLVSTFSMPAVELEPRVPALEILLRREFESLTGNVDFNGRFVLDSAGPICEMAMTLDGVSYSDSNANIANVAGTIEFEDILTMRSKPSQTITFDGATVGPMFFGHADLMGGETAATTEQVGPRRPGGIIVFRAESATSYFLESCDLLFLGGRMQAHALRYDPRRGDFTVTLYGDDLRMQGILGMISGMRGSSDAKLFAKLVITHNGKFFDFGDGYIYLMPGQDAKLKLTDFGTAVTDQLDAMEQSDERVGLAVQILRNFDIHDFRITFVGDRNAKDRIHARLRGEGTPKGHFEPVKLDYKLNIGGAVRQAINMKALFGSGPANR